MGLAQEAHLIYRSIFESDGIRYRRYPANANAVQVSGLKTALGAFQAYVEVVAAGVGNYPCWLYGLTYAGVLNLTDTVEMVFDVGVGAAGVEVSLSDGTGLFDARRVNIGPAMTGIIVRDTAVLPFPIRLTGSPRLALRAAQLIDAANNHTWSSSLHIVYGIGT